VACGADRKRQRDGITRPELPRSRKKTVRATRFLAALTVFETCSGTCYLPALMVTDFVYVPVKPPPSVTTSVIVLV